MIRKLQVPRIRFMREFIRNPMKMGAISPSSMYLAKKMISAINIQDSSFIIELGAGTGAITKRIIPLVNQDQFLTFEINPQLVTYLNKKYPELNVVDVSAEKLDQYLIDNQLPKANGIISGLPWAVFNNELQTNILNSIKNSMDDDSIFVTFAYIHALKLKPAKRFKQKLKETFGEVKTSSPVWRNIPPAILYICKK